MLLQSLCLFLNSVFGLAFVLTRPAFDGILAGTKTCAEDAKTINEMVALFKDGGFKRCRRL